MDSNNFKTDFGRSGASSSNLLNDLSEGGKESLSVSACTRKKITQLSPRKRTSELNIANGHTPQ